MNSIEKQIKEDFNEDVRLKCLLWSDRHCCLCKKACGTNIHVAHIDEEKPAEDNIDNAIPLCLDCHEKVGSYNPAHPMGSKYKTKELQLRRDQVYEEFTRHLVPPIELKVTQIKLVQGKDRELPDVGFLIIHHGDYLSARIKVKANLWVDGKDLGPLKGAYSGDVEWNINPRVVINGHIDIGSKFAEVSNIAMITTVTVIDQYKREHPQLPMGWLYKRKNNSWIPQPCVSLITGS